MSLPQETLSLLGNVPLFTGLPNEFLARQLGHSRRILAEGNTLRSLDGSSEDIYIILSGRLRTTQTDTTDGIVLRFSAGESVSEISLPNTDNSFDHLVADTDCELLCLDFATLASLADNSPQAARNVLGMLSAGITFSKRSSHDIESEHGYVGLNYVDELTGLYNGQWMFKTFERQIQRSAQNNTPSVLMLVSIDHFVRYNHTHGSLGGDQVLRTIAQTILTCLRPNDQAAHYYGEVFAVFMAHTTLEEANIATQRLLAQVSKADIVIPTGDALPHVTVSIGLAEVLADSTLQQLIAQATEAMRQQK